MFNFLPSLSPSQIVLLRNVDWKQATVSSSSMDWTWGLSLKDNIIIISSSSCSSILSWPIKLLSSIFWDIRACFSPADTICCHYENHLLQCQIIHHRTPKAFMCFFHSFSLIITVSGQNFSTWKHCVCFLSLSEDESLKHENKPSKICSFTKFIITCHPEEIARIDGREKKYIFYILKTGLGKIKHMDGSTGNRLNNLTFWEKYSFVFLPRVRWENQ